MAERKLASEHAKEQGPTIEPGQGELFQLIPVVTPEQLTTESDVEQKLVFPLLMHSGFLGYDPGWVKTKHYLPPTDIDKGSGRKFGYYPDFSIWHLGFPILILEAKSPDESVAQGLREARLYAIEINKRYPPGLNPISWITATNGRLLAVSHWDSEDVIEYPVEDLCIGSSSLDNLRDLIGREVIEDHAEAFNIQIRRPQYVSPATHAGGSQFLSSPLGFNNFAAELYPLIDMYFGKEGHERTDEIVRKGYVASDETTRYHEALERHLREKVVEIETGELQAIQTTRGGEQSLTKRISEHSSSTLLHGRLQLLIGSVGAGKTTFITRYYSHLVPPQLKDASLWSFIDFNGAPEDLSNAEDWVCNAFIDSFVEKNHLDSIYDLKNLRRIFAPDLNRREKGPYSQLKKSDQVEYDRRVASDLASWVDDKRVFSQNICRYYIGDRRKAIVVVFDNVDRLDRSQQLRIFQVAQWFKTATRTFVLLALRDVTYEAYKNQPPLNAFVNAGNFYISPPRFTDVVRKRLNLAIEFVTERVKGTLAYELPNGTRITYPSSALGKFLASLYVTLFHKHTQVAGAIEALAGKDVRRALGMFADLIVSKHLSESEITKAITKPEDFGISEASIIKILMRTRYRLFSEDNGYITNVFDCSPSWRRPSNFLYAEILEFLIERRKESGDINLEGYFSIATLADAMQKLGFVEDDVVDAIARLVKRGLLITDRQSATKIRQTDAVRIHASGFIHMRFLAQRLEYVAGVLPATNICENALARQIASTWSAQPDASDIRFASKIRLVREFAAYMQREFTNRCKRHAFFSEGAMGAKRLLENFDAVLKFAAASQDRPRRQH